MNISVGIRGSIVKYEDRIALPFCEDFFVEFHLVPFSLKIYFPDREVCFHREVGFGEVEGFAVVQSYTPPILERKSERASCQFLRGVKPKLSQQSERRAE